MEGAFAGRVRQVIASVDSRATPLTLPLDIRGTAFQQQVWQALRTIPAEKRQAISRWQRPLVNPMPYVPWRGLRCQQTGDSHPLSPRGA